MGQWDMGWMRQIGQWREGIQKGFEGESGKDGIAKRIDMGQHQKRNSQNGDIR